MNRSTACAVIGPLPLLACSPFGSSDAFAVRIIANAVWVGHECADAAEARRHVRGVDEANAVPFRIEWTAKSVQRSR